METTTLLNQATELTTAVKKARQETATYCDSRRLVIRQLRSAGVTYQTIADHLGVSISHVQAMLRSPEQQRKKKRDGH
jgi:transposase